MGLYYFGGIVSIFIAILTFVLIRQYTKNIRMCISLYCISIIPLAYAMNVRAASITCCLLLIEQIILKKVYDNKPCANLRPTKSLGVRDPVKAWPSET